MVSVTETSRLTSVTRGSGASSSAVGSFVGSLSVTPAPEGVSVVAGSVTVLPSGAVPVSDTSLTRIGLPDPSRIGVPATVAAVPVTVALLST